MAKNWLAGLATTLAIGALLAGCGDGDAGGAAAASTQTDERAATSTETTTEGGSGGGGRAVSVPVAELNGSGQTGEATLTELAGGTHVVVELRGGRPGTQSADIRSGTCDRPASKPEFRLANLSGGRGETHLEVPLESLISSDYVILVQRSTSDARTHVACAYLAAL